VAGRRRGWLVAISLLAAGLGAATAPVGRARSTTMRTGRATIAIATFGPGVPASLVERLRPVLEARFEAQVVSAGAVSLPAGAFAPSRAQHRAARLLDELARRRRPEWERLLGIADVDLFAPGLNFVFGEADGDRQVAVFSIARLRGEGDAAVLERRALVEAVHELGHTYGLEHCPDRHCVMWFSNTLAETDRKGDQFCARHEAQLAEVLRTLRDRRR